MTAPPGASERQPLRSAETCSGKPGGPSALHRYAAGWAAVGPAAFGDGPADRGDDGREGDAREFSGGFDFAVGRAVADGGLCLGGHGVLLRWVRGDDRV